MTWKDDTGGWRRDRADGWEEDVSALELLSASFRHCLLLDSVSESYGFERWPLFGSF